MYYSDEEAKQLICEYGKRVYRQGMVAGNEGNISVRTGADAVWVTPTGVSKNDLTPEMLSKTDLDGNLIIAGSLPISSESKMHYGVYRESGKARRRCSIRTPPSPPPSHAAGNASTPGCSPSCWGSSAKRSGRPLRPSGNL